MKRLDDGDQEEIEQLNAEPWMLDQLKLNPAYVSWGPGEDYMRSAEKGGGWESGVEFASWSEMEFKLDDLNECINFYFEVERASEECVACEGGSYNPETKKLADTFWNGWQHSLTKDEHEALEREGRTIHPRIGHDSINRHILVEQRAKRLGVYGHCPECSGRGSVFTEPAAKLQLVLWFIHPRKGASRGVRVAEIKREQLPAVYAYLREAQKRNTERFSKIPG